MALRTLSAFPGFADSVFSDRFNRIDRLFSQLTGDTPVSASPAYDLKKVDGNHYLLTLSVPGWKEDELEIETVGGNLHVSGKRWPASRRAKRAGFTAASDAPIFA